MNKWKQVIIGLTAIAGLSVAALPAVSVSAINVFEKCSSVGGNDSAVCKASKKDTNANASGVAKKLINAMLYVLGIIAVFMIVFGGIRYTTSGGNAASVKGAKETIMYAIIGLAVALLAWTIVNFVVGIF